jgi:hypothetical protein
MAEPIKVIASEISCNSTPNTFNLATLVRILNTSNTAFALVTQKYSNTSTKSTFTLGYAGSDESVVYVIKDSSDTLQSNSTAVVGVSVGYY